jgi:hypothetical protein
MPLARLELWNKIAAAGGSRLSTGGFLPYRTAWSTTRSLINPDSMTFSIPGNSEAASLVRKGLVARRWKSDSDVDWWPIDQVVTNRSAGTDVDVTCSPLSFLLGQHGIIADPLASPLNGIPSTSFGFVGLTFTEMLTTYVTTNASVTSVLPWVTLGTIEPTATFDLDVQDVNTLSLITAGLGALATLGVLAEFQLDPSGAINIFTTIGSTAPKFFVRVGKNLQSLKRTVDGSQQYSRLSPKLATLSDGSPTAIGLSRWNVTNVASNVLTLADPAGGAAPVGFDNQLNGLYVYVEATNSFVLITASSAANQTVTVTSGTGITAGMKVQFRTTNGSPATVPTFLDSPVYIATTAPGIGIVAGQIDKSTLQAIPNLAPNAAMQAWSNLAHLPDGWSWASGWGVPTNTPAGGSGIVFSQNTDPLFQQVSPNSLHLAGTYGMLVSPPIKIGPMYPGMPISARMRLILTNGWDAVLNSASLMQAQLGIMLSDGSVHQWWDVNPSDNLRVSHLQPGSARPSPWQQLGGGSFVDIILEDQDITVPSAPAFFSLNPGATVVSSADIAALSGSALGIVFTLFFLTQGAVFAAPIEGYIDSLMITASAVPPDHQTIYGEANQAWQAVNAGLALVNPAQASYEVALLDLARLNLDVDPSAFPTLGGSGVIFDAEVGANDNERLVEIVENQCVEGDTKLTFSNKNKRLTDLLFSPSSAGSTSLTPTARTGGTSGTGTTSGGSSLSAPVVTLTLDGSNVPTFVATVGPTIVSIKYAWSTSAQPDATTTAAGTQINAPTAFSASTSAITPGDTIYVSVLGYDALGQVTPLGIASLGTEAGTLNPNIPPFAMFGDAGSWQMETRFMWDDSLEYVTGGSTRNGNDARRTRHRTTNAPGNETIGGTGLTDFSVVTFIDLQSATIPADGLLILQASDRDSFTPSLFFWLDTSYALHAARTDSGADVNLITSANNVIPATGGGWLELIGKIHGSTGAALAYYTPVGGSRVKLFDNRALNTISNSNALGTVQHFYLGNDSWTHTVGATNATTVILFSDEHWFDRAGISLDDVSGRCCVSTMFPAGAGHYNDVNATYHSFNGENFEGDFEAVDFLSDGQKLSLALPTIDAGVGQILSVMPFFAIRSALTNDTSIVSKVGVRSGSTDSESSTIVHSADNIGGGRYISFFVNAASDNQYGYFAQMTDPSTAAAWTRVGLQNAEVLFDCVTASNGQLLGQLGVDVSCYPTSLSSSPGTKIGARTVPYHIIAGASFDYGNQGNEIYDRWSSARSVPCTVATTAGLPSHTYNTGASGVGATITASATGTLTPDGHLVALNDYVLVKDEGAFEQNGIYKCTTAGAVGVAFVLTRAVEFNTNAQFYKDIWAYVALGTANAKTKWKSGFDFSHIVGTSPIVFSQVTSGGAGNSLGDLLGAGGGTDTSGFANLRSSYGDIDLQLSLKSPASSGDGIGDDFALMEGSEQQSTPIDYGPSVSREVYQSIWFDLGSSSIATELGLLRVFAGLGGAEQCRLSLNSSRQFVATRRDSTPHTLQTSTATCPTSGRVGIAWRVRINPLDSTGGDSWVKVWLTTSGPTTRTMIVDTEGTSQPVRANGFGNTCGAVGFFGVYGSATDGASATFDDPVVANPGTVAKNTPMDNGRWGTLKPNAAGTFNDSTAHDFTKVQTGDWNPSSVPDGNYNVFTAAVKKDTYNVDAVAGDASVIQGIYPYAYVSLKYSPAGTKESGRQCLIIGGNLFKGPKRLVNKQWPQASSMLVTRMAKSRSQATGAQFTTTELGAAEVGWETLTHTNDDTYLRAVGIDYFYTWTI